MEGIEKLLAHINKLTPLTETEEELFRSVVKSKTLRRRQYLLEEGDICHYFNFVLKGCLRLYKVDEKGVEHVLQFATEDGWIGDIGSFHGEAPSKLFIDTLEPSQVLQIKKADLWSLYIQVPKLNRYFRVLIENAFVNMQERVTQNISSTAEERYQTFLANYPHLTNRISQIQIAAYIGVTPEFLSKIRKKLMTR